MNDCEQQNALIPSEPMAGQIALDELLAEMRLP